MAWNSLLFCQPVISLASMSYKLGALIKAWTDVKTVYICSAECRLYFNILTDIFLSWFLLDGNISVCGIHQEPSFAASPSYSTSTIEHPQNSDLEPLFCVHLHGDSFTPMTLNVIHLNSLLLNTYYQCRFSLELSMQILNYLLDISFQG